MSDEQVIAVLKARQGDKSVREFARELNVSAAYLSDVYLGRRAPGPKILSPLGYKRVRTITTTIVKA
jgi:hypothetical protein